MKRFLLKLSYTVLPVWLLLVGTVIYMDVCVMPRVAGDIGVLAYIPVGHAYDSLLEKHMMDSTLFITIDDPSQLQDTCVDVLTVGDSFSQQGNGGYQNYMCAKGLTVINYQRTGDPVQTGYNLLDALDSTHVKAMVIETVERELVNRATSFNASAVWVPKVTYNADKEKTTTTKEDPRSPLTRARDFILLQLHYKTPVYRCRLSQPCFTCDEPETLYFYYEDLTTPAHINETQGKAASAMFDALCRRADEKGIDLVFMVAVDKYDLYQDYIVDNPYGPKTVNEDLTRFVDDTTVLLVSKHYLLPAVQQGEPDIFMYHGTHWSYKGSAILGDEIHRRLKN